MTFSRRREKGHFDVLKFRRRRLRHNRKRVFARPRHSYVLFNVDVVDLNLFHMIPRLNMITLPEQQRAGRLTHFMSNWKIITSDKSVLETVGGYRIALTSKPHQWRKRMTKVKSLYEEVMLTQTNIASCVKRSGASA